VWSFYRTKVRHSKVVHHFYCFPYHNEWNPLTAHTPWIGVRSMMLQSGGGESMGPKVDVICTVVS
jgi:hypothetical protein